MLNILMLFPQKSMCLFVRGFSFSNGESLRRIHVPWWIHIAPREKALRSFLWLVSSQLCYTLTKLGTVHAAHPIISAWARIHNSMQQHPMSYIEKHLL